MKRGGKREGAGRKKTPKDYAEGLKKEWLKTEKKLKNEFGMSLTEKLQRMVFDATVQDAVKASIGKQRIELLGVKESAQTIDTHFHGPAIGLPPIQEKPKEFQTPPEEPEQKKEELH